MRHLLLIAALVATGLLPGGETANAAGAGNAYLPSRADVDLADVDLADVDPARLDAAMFAAVRAEFPGRDVRIRLAAPALDDDPTPAQRGVSVDGRVLLGGSDRWLPFHVTALYDTQSTTARTTSLEFIAADRPGNLQVAASADHGLADELQTEASRKLHEEFASQPADLVLDRVQVRRAGDYLALLADGRADFGVEGTADATIRALYDPRGGRWLRLDYELGDGG